VKGNSPNYVLAAVFFLALWPFVSAVATPCTPGVDCYCDKVRSGSLSDPSLLWCEDFEAPTLRLDQGFGNGPPYYGPQYDHSFPDWGTNNRGNNSYWYRVYGMGVRSIVKTGFGLKGDSSGKSKFIVLVRSSGRAIHFW
jgi:hypothetical protein